MNNSRYQAESRAHFLRQEPSEHSRDFPERKSKWQWSRWNATRKRLLTRFRRGLERVVAQLARFDYVFSCFEWHSEICEIEQRNRKNRSARFADCQSFSSAIAGRALFYAPQNREDSRSSDFESRLVVLLIILNSHREKWNRARGAVDESLNERNSTNGKLVSDSDWWSARTCLVHYPTSVRRWIENWILL